MYNLYKIKKQKVERRKKKNTSKIQPENRNSDKIDITITNITTHYFGLIHALE